MRDFFRIGLLLCFAGASFPVSTPLAAETLVSWRQVLLKIDDPGPRLHIEADGRVEAHIPAWLQGAGDFTFILGEDELLALRSDLSKLEGIDVRQLYARRAEGLRQLAASGQMVLRAGAATSYFELSGVGAFRWRGPGVDADALDLNSPENDPLRSLAALQQRFENLVREASVRDAQNRGAQNRDAQNRDVRGLSAPRSGQSQPAGDQP